MAAKNANSRLEAFCDGVFAIALTLLIIDIKVPAGENIRTTADLWKALSHLWPSIFAFTLSFGIILITWVNHHATLKLVDKSSQPFIYANGFLLLTIVILPFPTALLAEYGLTDHAAPAVILYSFVNLAQGIGWTLIGWTGLKPKLLAKNEAARKAMADIYRNGYYAIALYTICAIAAFWFPLTTAVIITAIWIVWLFVGLNLKDEDENGDSKAYALK